MNDDDLVAALKAVAHPVRLRILQTLSGAERNVGEIDDAAEIGQPTLSQQLAVLRGAGLVATRKDAKLVYYRIDETKLGHVTAALAQFAGEAVGSESPVRRRTSAPGVANFAQLG
ncbi:ArsR/SmtB family transcription factor [Qipengyuania citrea]|uniref:ArsR/SmtB family transcription factor n=1 Tax=Qipengyuania citrea TaxID=225971 RepID=UPI0032994644